ncbi:hypothetical protein D3C77_466220 [compost metagenome]
MKLGRALLYKCFFARNGDARALLSTVAVIVVATLTVMPSRYGFLDLNLDPVLVVLVPVAGTIIALALPAAQLAYSTKAELLKVVETLVKANEGSSEIANYLDRQVVKYKMVLSPMRLIVVYSIASFLVGLLGMLKIFVAYPLWMQISISELIASLSVWFLVASLLWFIPLLQSAVDFLLIEQMSNLFRSMPKDDGTEEKKLADNQPTPPGQR